MPDEPVKHNHTANDIIIKDQDGSYKILRDGKFVPLDDMEAKLHDLPATKPAPQPSAPPAPSAAKIPVNKPQPAPALTKPADPTGDQAETILQKTNLTFASGEVRSRVKNILISHLKGVRKPFETKIYLMKGVRDGGAGLTEQEAELVLMATSGYKALSSQPAKTEPPQPPIRAAVPVGKEVSKPAPTAIETMPEQDILAPKMEAAKAVGPAFAPRPTLADVQKPMRSLGGPVDQLSYDLMTWRRLGSDPRDRIKKIETQLDVLEQDGFPERLKGIYAWHNSEVVRKYIEAGKQSVETSQGLDVMLGSGGEQTLSLAEWQAVAELNKRIRI